jgi:hypothetical protein
MPTSTRALTVLALCALLLSAPLLTACGDGKPRPTQRDLIASTNNLRNLTLILADRSIRKGWPPYDGKGFVLSTVALGLVDARNPRNLEVFFSPLDRPDPMPGSDEYKAVKKAALAASTDFSHLTSYAGRRNADPEYKITPEMLKRTVPVMADVSMPGYAIIAYSDGRVKVKKAADLGLPRGTQVTVGDDANVEELRGLSLD